VLVAEALEAEAGLDPGQQRAGAAAELVVERRRHRGGALDGAVAHDRAQRVGVGVDEVGVELAGGERIEADELVLATQAPAAAALLSTITDAPGIESVASYLASIPHAEVTLVHLGLDEGELPGRPRGFGYLVPPDAGPDAPRVLGTVFGSDLFPHRAPVGAVAVSAFYRSSELGTTEPEAAGRIACEDLARAFHLPRTPRARVTRVLHWKGVIPQYGVGHAEAIARIEQDLARDFGDIHLAGSYVGGVSVDDVLARGLEIARRASSGRTHEVSV